MRGGILQASLDFRIASADPTMWALVCLQSLGVWGNTVFIICSAWFLCLSGRFRLNKAIKLLFDVLAISIAILLLALLMGVPLGARDIVKSFFPTTFENNWFITCYILLYAMHPGLNWILERLGQRGHAVLALTLFGLYMLLPAIHGGHFYITKLVIMITLYVLVAYGRYYLIETLSNRRVNWGMFLVGTFGAIALVLLLEQAGLRVSSLSGKMLHFDQNGDPLLFLSAFGLFNLIRSRPFTSMSINRVSGLMLLVYLIHENLIVRLYARPAIWQWIHDSLGYDLLFVWLGLFAAGLFLIALLVAFLYEKSLGKFVDFAGLRVEGIVRKAGGSLVNRVCALK